MKTEGFAKQARIPVRVRNGEVEFLYDTRLPNLREGIKGELVVDINDVGEGKWQDFFVGEETLEIAPAGTTVVFGVAIDKGADEHRKLLVTRNRNSQLMGVMPAIAFEEDNPLELRKKYQVEAMLDEPLCLVLRGESLAQLSHCQVSVPALNDLGRPFQARSLNEALVWISQAFEPERRSASGDVFRVVHLLIENRWRFLKELREEQQAKHEATRWAKVGLDPTLVKRRTGGGNLSTKAANSTHPNSD